VWIFLFNDIPFIIQLNLELIIFFYCAHHQFSLLNLFHFPSRQIMIRDSSVGITTGWTAEVQFQAGAIDFSLLHSIQTGSVDHPASYPLGTWGFFPGE
jgi:hypothetical protein